MDQYTNKNRDVRRLSAYRDHPAAAEAPKSFDFFLKEIEERRNRPSRKWYTIAAGIVLLLAGGFFFVWQSASLRVVLTPKKTTVNPEGQLIVLPFEEISLKVAIDGAHIPFTVKKVEERARGTIVVYNAYSTKPHRFVARTRFESSDGKIYRIESPLLIPGAREEGGTVTPGSIEAEVVAEDPGEEYNKESADFTVPGLKGSVLFEKFYARSKEPLSGGRKGEERVVDSAALTGETFTNQERSFADKLRVQMPDGFLLPEAAWSVAYEGEFPALSNPSQGGPVSSVSPRRVEAEPELYAAVTGWMIKRDNLGVKLASLFFEPDQAGRVILVDDSRLSLKNLSSPNNRAEQEDSLRVMVQGEAVYAERIDKESIPKSLATFDSSNDIDAFFKTLGSVESATLIFSPAFLKRIPSNSNRITIDVTR